MLKVGYWPVWLKTAMAFLNTELFRMLIFDWAWRRLPAICAASCFARSVCAWVSRIRRPLYCSLRLLISLESALALATRSFRLGMGWLGAAPPMPLGRTRLASAATPITVTARRQARPDPPCAFRAPLGT